MWIGAQALIDTEKTGGRNPLVEAAAELSILPGERTPEEEELDMIRGEKVADRIEDDPRFAPQAADPGAGTEASNGAGSYEAFMARFGARMLPPQV